jgi:hypothetical protein
MKVNHEVLHRKHREGHKVHIDIDSHYGVNSKSFIESHEVVVLKRGAVKITMPLFDFCKAVDGKTRKEILAMGFDVNSLQERGIIG